MCKSLIVYVTPREDNFCFNIFTYNLSTGNQVHRYSQDVKDLIKFFDNPPNFIKKYVKGIVCNFNGFFKNDNVDDSFWPVAAKLSGLNIPYRFIANLHITAMCKLIGAKIDSEIDKEILQIYGLTNMTKVLSLHRTEDGYKITEIRQFPTLCDPEVVLKSSNPSKIIISNPTPDKRVIPLKTSFSKWKPIVLDGNVSKYLFEALKEIVDHMYNVEGSKKYFVIPQVLHNISISIADKKSIVVKKDAFLPLTESCIVSRFEIPINLLKDSPKDFPEHIKNCHRFTLSLSVDLNNCPAINIKPVILSKIKNMPKRLKIENTKKLPIIGFFDNSSVICIWHEKENCYKYLDSWNGKFGKDLFLDFMLPKPTLISSFTEVTSLSGAVYDLIKIMSMPRDNVKVENQWKFTFTENDENPVLLEFDTFENERKAATPAFLMALMLKKHIRAIRREIGEKPKKLGFRLFDDFESPEAKKRVEAGLQEACEWKGIECCFI